MNTEFLGYETRVAETCRLECSGSGLGRRLIATLYTSHGKHKASWTGTCLLSQLPQGTYI